MEAKGFGSRLLQSSAFSRLGATGRSSRSAARYTVLQCEGKLLSDLHFSQQKNKAFPLPPLESNVSYFEEGLLNHKSLYFFFFLFSKT